MTVTLAEIKKLGFEKTHMIIREDDQLRFDPVNGGIMDDSPSVYLWVKTDISTDQGEVLYVGRAGKGVSQRCRQHQGSFRAGGGTGQRNALELTEILKEKGASVCVMAKKAGKTELFDHTVSLYAAEENALYVRLRPRINRATFPIVGDAPSTSSRNECLLNISELINRRFVEHDEEAQDDMQAQLDAFGVDGLSLLQRMLEFVENYMVDSGHSSKLIKGYTGQIAKCDGVTALGFGRIINKNFAPDSWVARIFLTEEFPRLALPLRVLRPDPVADIEKTEGSFTATDIERLLSNPSDYIREDYLK